MPLRQKSPQFEALFKRELEKSPQEFATWAPAMLDDSRYFHWSELIRREPPEGFTHEQWWLNLKLKRMASQRTVSLTNKDRQPFSFTLTDEILQSVESIASRLGGPREVTDGTLTRAGRDEYILRSLVEEAITSSQLEGASTTRRVAVEMLDTGRPPSDQSELMILNNYLGMEFVKKNAAKPLTPTAIVELHRILTEGTLDDPADEGRLEVPGGQRVSVWARDEQVHIPPPATELPDRLASLCEFANQESTSSPYIPTIVRAIIVHFMCGYDHYFADGNGRTARASFYWLMLHHGYWLSEYLTISKTLRTMPGKYGDAYEFSEDDNDLTYFIHFQLRVIVRALDDLDSYIARRQEQAKRIRSVLRSAVSIVNSRQGLIIEWLDRDDIPAVTAQVISARYGVTSQTARNDLNHLERLGLLEKKEGKHPITWITIPHFRESLTRLEDTL